MNNKFPIEYNNEDAIFYISVYVDDFTKAKEFYSNIFGFQVVFEKAEEMGWLELSTPTKDVRIGLSLREKLSNDEKKSIMSISVKDVTQVRGFLEKNQVKIGEIQNIPDMVAILDSWDPFGNLIQLIGPPLPN